MTRLAFTVLHSAWYADGREFPADPPAPDGPPPEPVLDEAGVPVVALLAPDTPLARGRWVVEDPDPALVRLAAHAHAAGAIVVDEGLDLSTVQSQEDAERALAEAMGEHVVERLPDGTSRSYWTGPWQEGQDEQGRSELGDGVVAITPDVEEVQP